MNPHDKPRDEQQSPRPRLPLMVMACSAGGILLSFGLCGGNLVNGERAAVGIAIPSLAREGVILFWLSILTLIGGFLWLIVAAIINPDRR